MLLLTDEDRRYLARGLLPSARALAVPEDLRGWSWSRPPLEPVYPVSLALHEVASHYCATGRDLYLRRVCGLRAAPSVEMRLGAVLHELLAAVYVLVKGRLYAAPEARAASLRGVGAEALLSIEGLATGSEGTALAGFLEDALVAEAARVVAAQPRIEADALVARVAPAIFGVRLDGSVLGLSKQIVADAVAVPWPVVIEFKFGLLQEFHRVATAGYALAFEATHEVPVNAGVIIGISISGDRITISKDFHLVDAELRQRFVESRDERARMLYHESDPGLAKDHPSSCPFLADCGVQASASRNSVAAATQQKPVPVPGPSTLPGGRVVSFPGSHVADSLP